MDLPGFENNFYSHPVAYSPTSDLFAILLHNAVNPSDTQIVLSVIYLYNPGTKKVRSLVLCGETEKPFSCNFSPDGKLLALGKINGIVEIWSLNEGRDTLLTSIKCNSSSPLLSTVVFQNNHVIYAGNNRGDLFKITLKPKENGKVYFLKHIPGHNRTICSIVFSYDGKFLATGSDDNSVIIRDAKTLEILRTLKMHQAAIRAIAFDPSNSSRIAIGGGKNDPRISIYNFLYREKPMLEILMDSQITNILWEKDRLISTHQDGSYQVTPLALHKKIPAGQTHRFPVFTDRVLTAHIRDKDHQRMLFLAGGSESDSSFKTFILPKLKSQPKAIPIPVFQQIIR